MGTAVRMYFDPRYRVRRSTQGLVSLIVAIFVLNLWVFEFAFPVPVVSSILEKLGDVVLIILLYKVVSREVVRYRQSIAQILAWQGVRRTAGPVIVSGEPAMTQLETD
jgi:hypothetical protein